MELLNLLLFVAITDRKKPEKKRLPYFEKRKLEYENMKKKREMQFDKYAKKMIEINEISKYTRGTELFDGELSKIRGLFGNRVADGLIERIEKVNPTDFDTIKYL